ncbi:MAG: hypothetical protein Tsb0019_16480 [Roseibium sp.]
MPVAGRSTGNNPVNGARYEARGKRDAAAGTQTLRTAKRPDGKGKRSSGCDMEYEGAQPCGLCDRDHDAGRDKNGGTDDARSHQSGSDHGAESDRIGFRMSSPEETPGQEYAACDDRQDEPRHDPEELEE